MGVKISVLDNDWYRNKILLKQLNFLTQEYEIFLVNLLALMNNLTYQKRIDAERPVSILLMHK